MPALSGVSAAAAYDREHPDVFIVYPEWLKAPAVRLIGGTLPNFRPECDDVLVWPDDLSWTMAFTHEESLGLGPYYCRREWVVPARPRGRRRRAF